MKVIQQMRFSNNIDLGKVKVGEKRIIEIDPDENRGAIKKLVGSCSCDLSRYVEDRGIIRIIQNGHKIPRHLADRGWYISNKRYRVDYKDGTSDIIDVRATICE